MGETRVDLLHLLEDLRDAYPGGTEEAILTEIVANSLDSGAATIAVSTDAVAASIAIVDDGAGMKRRELARYHDIASSTKQRGEGIGFAGVGIKIGLLASTEVLTETRRGAVHVATTWGLTHEESRSVEVDSASAGSSPSGAPPSGCGSTTRCPRSSIRASWRAVIRRHFEPLLESGFHEILAARYRRGRSLRAERRRSCVPRRGARRRRRRSPFAWPVGASPPPSATCTRDGAPLPEERRGIAVSTFGKVIRRGWDWLGITPASPDHVGGLIEVPALAECLTLNKADFIRAGTRGAIYLSYRKAIQEAVVRQLQLWGDVRDETDRAQRRAARPLERDLESVLAGPGRRVSPAVEPGRAAQGRPAPARAPTGPPRRRGGRRSDRVSRSCRRRRRVRPGDSEPEPSRAAARGNSPRPAVPPAA